MLAVKERIRRMNRRRNVGGGDENDERSSAEGDDVYDKPPQYRAVSCGHLAAAQSLNSQLSLLGWKYDELIQVDKLVDLVSIFNYILSSSLVKMLEKVWKEYKESAPCPSQVLRVKLSVQLRRMREGVEGFTWEEIRELQSELVVVKEMECLETISEENMLKVLNMYQQKREARNMKMATLYNMMSRMAKLLRRVGCGKGVGTVPDLEGCLSDCTRCLEDETKEEWGNLMQPLIRFVVDRIQQLMDIVKVAWVEMGMEERLQQPSLERCVGRREALSEVPQCNEVTVQDENSLDQDLVAEDSAGEITGRVSGASSKECKQSDKQGSCTCSRSKGNSRGSSWYQELASPGLSDGLCVTGSVRPSQAYGDQPALSRLNCQPFQAYGEEPSLSSLSVGLDCQPLASSTPRSVKSLSTCLQVHSGGNNTSSEFESGLLGIGELLSFVEQFAGVVPSNKLKEELAKLDRGTGFVRWKSFEKRLEEDPGIVFGEN